MANSSTFIYSLLSAFNGFASGYEIANSANRPGILLGVMALTFAAAAASSAGSSSVKSRPVTRDFYRRISEIK